jgi:methyl-accepting chemotaxis protein
MHLIELLRRFTIRTRMLGAIVMVMALLGGVGGAGLLGLTRVAGLGEAFINETHADSVKLAELRTALGDVLRHEKDMVINYEKPDQIAALRAKWQKAVDEVRVQAQALSHGESDAGTEAAAQIDKQMAAYGQQAGHVLKQVEVSAYDTATVANRMLNPAKAAIVEAEAAVKTLQAHLEKEAQAAGSARAGATQQAYLVFGAVVLAAILLVVPLTLANMVSICRPMDEARAFAGRIATGDLSSQIVAAGEDESAQLLKSLAAMQESLRSIVGQVRDASENIQFASAEVASGNSDLSARTEQAASNLQQTAASIEQLTGTVKHSAESASTANQLASSAARVAQRGGQVVSQVVSTMNEINTSSKKIADIIGVIDGIAFQTNILALNAAVEAARAGEQGRGFAVVAGEVRSLAQRSAEAAKEIKALIGTSVDKVETGSKLVSDAGATMNEIVASVQRVTDIIGEITAASGEQSLGIGQVNSAVTELDRMTQQNAALVQESAAAAESLKEQALKLAGVVATFRLSSDVVTPRAEAQAAARLVVARAQEAARRVPARRPTRPATTDDEAGWETF